MPTSETRDTSASRRADPLRQHRQSLRLKRYDYTTPGAYFVTVVVNTRECLLGAVTPNGNVCLTALGREAANAWASLPAHFENVRLDAWIVMPNHLHGLLMIKTGPDRARVGIQVHSMQLPGRPAGTESGSLGEIMQNYKSVSTRRINTLRGTAGARFWQRNYYEHIVRNADELNLIRDYIQANPARWAVDALNALRAPM